MAPPILDSLVERLAGQDFDGLAACLDPAVRLRELIPAGLGEHHGPEAAASRFRSWFGDASRLELLESRVEAIVDRWHVTYQIDLDESGGSYRVDQHLFCDIGDQLVERIDLLCSGFRPVVGPVGRGKHYFDAGELGCADGLADAFRCRLVEIPVGDSLVVAARDPAAREDLPSLARLLGGRVISVETHDGGQLELTVERGR
jgi:TusA-related sulfurtransferase